MGDDMIPKKLQAQVDKLFEDFFANKECICEFPEEGPCPYHSSDYDYKAGAQAMAKLILESEEFKELIEQVDDIGRGRGILLFEKNSVKCRDVLANWQAFVGEEE